MGWVAAKLARRIHLGGLRLGEVVGCRQEERRQLVALDRLHQRVADLGQQHAGEDVDLVLLDQLPVLGLGGGRVALGVLFDQLQLAPGHLAARDLHPNFEAVEHVLAGLREDAGQRGQEADLDGIGRRGRGDHGRGGRKDEGHGERQRATRHGQSSLGVVEQHLTASGDRVEARWTGKRSWTSCGGARRSPSSWAGPSA